MELFDKLRSFLQSEYEDLVKVYPGEKDRLEAGLCFALEELNKFEREQENEKTVENPADSMDLYQAPDLYADPYQPHLAKA